MTDFMTSRAGEPTDRAIWETEEIEEAAWDLATLDTDGMPALARQFQITDMQHWIDLCA